MYKCRAARKRDLLQGRTHGFKLPLPIFLAFRSLVLPPVHLPYLLALLLLRARWEHVCELGLWTCFANSRVDWE